MTKTIRFCVEGAPFGKQRPRHNRFTGVTYTPAETKHREQSIAAAYRAQMGGYMFPQGSYLLLSVTAYMPIPKSASKKKRQQMLDGEIRPAVKPDCDNIFKLVADALNGIAYDDDKCIVDATIRKYYSEHPRTEIMLTETINSY